MFVIADCEKVYFFVSEKCEIDIMKIIDNCYGIITASYGTRDLPDWLRKPDAQSSIRSLDEKLDENATRKRSNNRTLPLENKTPIFTGANYNAH